MGHPVYAKMSLNEFHKVFLKSRFRKFFNYQKPSFKPPNAIINLSDQKLSLKEFHALKFALDHPRLPLKAAWASAKRAGDSMPPFAFYTPSLKPFQFQNYLLFLVVSTGSILIGPPRKFLCRRVCLKVKQNDIKTNAEKHVYVAQRKKWFFRLDDEFRDQLKFETRKFLRDGIPQNRSLYRTHYKS